MNIYWKIACAVALAVVAFVGGWKVNGYRMQTKIDTIQQEHDKAVAESEKALIDYKEKAAASVRQQAAQYQEKVASANKDIEQLKKDLRNASKKNPLPADCRLDSERMRIIKTATARANSSSASSR